MKRGEEDYIKSIYQLSLELKTELVGNQYLIARLNHTPQTVIEMIKKLQDKGYVQYTPYKGTSLTEEGKTEAVRLTRAHRLWELFLTEKLGLNWSEVHEEAERLEHATSSKISEKLYEYLGSPEICPHGNPIPDLEGNIRSIDMVSLDQVETNERFNILKIIDDKELYHYLKPLGLEIHDQLTVIKKDAFEGPITIEKNDQQIVIGFKAAQHIFGS